MMETSGSSGAFLSMLGQPVAVAADPEKLQQLVDMGFDREKAR